MDNIVKGLCEYILSNLYEDITMEKLEKEFYYNKYYLIRLFKSYTGYTIKEFINTAKILKSVDPLLFTDDSILKIALNNGFNSQEYYSEKFQDVLGMAPLRFRKSFQNIDKLSDINELKSRKQYLMYLNQFKNELLNIHNTLEMPNKIKKLVR